MPLFKPYNLVSIFPAEGRKIPLTPNPGTAHPSPRTPMQPPPQLPPIAATAVGLGCLAAVAVALGGEDICIARRARPVPGARLMHHGGHDG